MRALEVFHQARIPDLKRILVRVDGRCFSKLTAVNFEKPFDATLHQLMVRTTERLVEELGAIYAYTESDEISLLLPHNWSLFSREHEKLVSLSAGIASAAFTANSGLCGVFDSRVIIANSVDEICDYFRWRMLDAGRCCLNSWVYWTLRKAGQSVLAATRASNGADFKQKVALLADHGILYDQLPCWQRRGTGIYWVEYDKDGYDPVAQKTVVARRRRIHLDEELPGPIDYTTMVAGLISLYD